MSLDAHDLKAIADSAKKKQPRRKTVKSEHKFNQEDINAHVDVMEELVQKYAKEGHIRVIYRMDQFIQDPMKPAEEQPNTVPIDRLRAFLIVVAEAFAARNKHFFTLQDRGACRIMLDWSGDHEC